MSSSKQIDLRRDFAAGVYQILQTGDTFNHVGIFYPALLTVAPLTFPLVHPPPPMKRGKGGGGVSDR